jgi:oxygen-independent coproporphyrinogen-3 oxidase
MSYKSRDNEFIAWYPCALQAVGERPFPFKETAFYIHIPFCDAICDYCGFSVETTKKSNIDEYLDSLIAEIKLYKVGGRLNDRNFSCGAYGGGTPSVLSAEQFYRISECIAENLAIDSNSEITIEANPISLTQGKIDAYAASGVNRISLGVQSLNEALLHAIGRPHRRRDIDRSINLICSSPISNFSLDLMYGLPGQTEEELRNDIEAVLEYSPPHLSCFKLELIPFTRLFLRRGTGQVPPLPDGDALYRIESILIETLYNAGYEQYGAFNFSKPGFQSRHNWMVFGAPQCDFIGFGNSAFSFVDNFSYCNYTKIQDYSLAISNERLPISHIAKANVQDRMSRYFILGFKMGGVKISSFVNEFGISPFLIFKDVLASLVVRGLVDIDGDKIATTKEGKFYINNVCKEFYSGDNIGSSQHAHTFIAKISPSEILNAGRRIKVVEAKE